MKQSKIWTIVLSVLFALQILAEGFALFILYLLNMLPAVYFLIIAGVFLLLVLITGLLVFAHKKGRTPSVARRIIAGVLAVLVICGCVLMFIAVRELYETIHNVTAPQASETTRSIYVRMDDPAKALEDTATYEYAAVGNYDTDSTLQAISVIEKTLGTSLHITYYESVPHMVEGLYSGEVDAVILNSAYVFILEDMEGYEDFSQKARIVHDVPVVEKLGSVQETELEETQPVEMVSDVTNTPFAVYISGSDTRSSYLPNRTRSDVNILAIVNPVSKQVLLLNTPRDYYVQNPAGGGSRDKLTHCGIYGVENSMKALENLYGVQIDYNARINFTGFETLIDAIGGVTVYSDVGFSTVGGTYVSAGENNLNGTEALAFARERYNLSGGDNARGKNQMKVITAVLKKLTSGKTLLVNYSQILNSLEGMFATSMPMEDISKLVKMQLTDMTSWNIQSFAVTGNNGSAATYSAPGQKLSVMYVNDTLVECASELIRKVYNGENFTEEDILALTKE